MPKVIDLVSDNDDSVHLVHAEVLVLEILYVQNTSTYGKAYVTFIVHFLRYKLPSCHIFSKIIYLNLQALF